MSEYGPRPSSDPNRHPGGRTCAGMALLGAAIPALLFALARKAFKRK